MKEALTSGNAGQGLYFFGVAVRRSKCGAGRDRKDALTRGNSRSRFVFPNVVRVADPAFTQRIHFNSRLVIAVKNKP